MYQDVIKHYGVKDVVVGSIFGETKSATTVPFSVKEKLFYQPVADETKIKQALLASGQVRVFSRSTQVVHYTESKTN